MILNLTTSTGAKVSINTFHIVKITEATIGSKAEVLTLSSLTPVTLSITYDAFMTLLEELNPSLIMNP